jgi:hypothetical protein
MPASGGLERGSLILGGRHPSYASRRVAPPVAVEQYERSGHSSVMMAETPLVTPLGAHST